MAKLMFTAPPEKDGETWKRLPLCGVWASDLGRIWIEPPGPGLLAPPATVGYIMVSVPGINGGKPVGVHRLVAHAFHGECPDGMCVDHIDCDTQNNRPGNLQYVTPAENTRLHWQRKKAMGPFAWKATRFFREARRYLARSKERSEAQHAEFMAAVEREGITD